MTDYSISRCDGQIHCKDMTYYSISRCDGQIHCKDMTYYSIFRCDGQIHCKDMTDEIGCDAFNFCLSSVSINIVIKIK